MEKSELRFNHDIGLFTIDRSRKTCIHATAFCKEHCYNKKLYKVFKNMVQKDDRNDLWWESLTGEKLNNLLNRRRKSTSRIRFMSRGEGVTDKADIEKIADLVKCNSNRKFIIPTRAWRNRKLRGAIEDILFDQPNIKALASLDPSNSKEEAKSLDLAGWSTMFFGNDKEHPLTNPHKCAKTWNHLKEHCAVCKDGCFSSKQVHVWLKQH